MGALSWQQKWPGGSPTAAAQDADYRCTLIGTHRFLVDPSARWPHDSPPPLLIMCSKGGGGVGGGSGALESGVQITVQQAYPLACCNLQGNSVHVLLPLFVVLNKKITHKLNEH